MTAGIDPGTFGTRPTIQATSGALYALTGDGTLPSFAQESTKNGWTLHAGNWSTADAFGLASDIVAFTQQYRFQIPNGALWPSTPLTVESVSIALQYMPYTCPSVRAIASWEEMIWTYMLWVCWAHDNAIIDAQSNSMRWGGTGISDFARYQAVMAFEANGLTPVHQSIISALMLTGGLFLAAVGIGSWAVAAGAETAAGTGAEAGAAAGTGAEAGAGAAGAGAEAGAGAAGAGAEAGTDLAGAAAGAGSAVDDLTALESELDTLDTEYNSFAGSVKGALSSVWGAFKGLYNSTLKRLFAAIGSVLRKMHDWMESRLRPVLNSLKRVRAYLDKLFKTYIKPLLTMMQKVRRVLNIMKLLHIGWAAALDKQLQGIEAQITHNFLRVRGYLNQVMDVCNAIADPSKMVRIVAVAVRGQAGSAALCRAMTGLPLGMFLASSRPGAPAWAKRPKSAADLVDPDKNPPASVLASQVSSDAMLDASDAAAGVSDDLLDSGPVLDYYEDTIARWEKCDELNQRGADNPILMLEAAAAGEQELLDAAADIFSIGAQLNGGDNGGE